MATSLKVSIRKNHFQDALKLMRISKNAGDLEGVNKAVAVMATDKAKYAIEDAGLMTKEIKDAAATDLVIAVEAKSEVLADKAVSVVEGLISTEDASERVAADIIGQELRVINIGLDIFKDALESQGVKVVHVDWEVPANGDEKVVRILKKML